MKIIAISTLREFWAIHPDAEQPLKAWHDEVRRARWRTMHDIRQTYATASILKNNRVVFNIKGNRYRLIAAVWFGVGQVYIKFIGTHGEYDRIDAETVERKPL